MNLEEVKNTLPDEFEYKGKTFVIQYYSVSRYPTEGYPTRRKKYIWKSDEDSSEVHLFKDTIEYFPVLKKKREKVPKAKSQLTDAKVLEKIGPWTIEIFTNHFGRKRLVVCSGLHTYYPIIYDDKTVAWDYPEHIPTLVKRWVRNHSSELYDLLRARGFEQKGKGKQLKYADYWKVGSY